MTIPRDEYPRPQFVRTDWRCLNGRWQFEIDQGDSGEARGLVDRELSGEITVPFCPESALSGVGNVDFMAAVWYRRVVSVPAEWAGRRVLLHFQAVDNEATVWINGRQAAWHHGGWTPFSVDLGDVAGKDVTIVVRARDDHRQKKARGKQCNVYANRGCLYTRTTGIWQAVWMEPVSAVSLGRPRIWPDVGRSAFRVELPLSLGRPRPSVAGLSVRGLLVADGEELSRCESSVCDLAATLELPVPQDEVRLWSCEDPYLYDLRFELLDAEGTLVDAVKSYAGLRSVQLDGHRVLLNGAPVFQRLVLDQGYYPDGIMTAPSDEALVRDIELSMAAGFNGARLHQKVFEERFLYHADRLGYLCWGEYGDWGIDDTSPLADLVTGWSEMMRRDLSHPSIVGWCPLNEHFHFPDPTICRRAGLMHALVGVTKTVDPTRPVIDVSGGYHCVPDTDILDNHDYDQAPASFAENYDQLANGVVKRLWAKPSFDPPPIDGRPYFVSEFGGTWWDIDRSNDADDLQSGWGYGNRPETIEEFYRRFEGLCTVLLRHPHMFGYCYTQLTDVFQELNGIYAFDRRVKFDIDRLRAVQQRQAAIEG
jgi:beta-galactosidase/beta-glucuronidase